MIPVRVLMADDDPRHLELLLLACEPGAPGVVATGVTRLEQLERTLKNERIDALVLDYNLKPWLASEVLARIAPLIGDMPVIVVSGSEEQIVVIQSLRSGVSDFVPKREAVRGDVLLRRLAAALERSRERRTDENRQRRHERALMRLGEIDALTGLGNRRGFTRLERSERWRRRVRAPITLAILDIDHFKTVNDRYGHAVGDQVLRDVADVIRASLGPGGAAFRWGGEEFLIALPGCDARAGYERLESLRAEIAGRTRLPDAKGVTVSIGLSLAATNQDASGALELADAALYHAKNTGRNRVCGRDPQVALSFPSQPASSILQAA